MSDPIRDLPLNPEESGVEEQAAPIEDTAPIPTPEEETAEASPAGEAEEEPERPGAALFDWLHSPWRVCCAPRWPSPS